MVPVGARAPSDTTRYPKLICCLIVHFTKDHKVLFFENIGGKSSGASPSKSQPTQHPASNSQEPQGTRDWCVLILDRHDDNVGIFISHVPCCCDPTHDKVKVRKGGFNLSHSLRMQPTMAGKAWPRE